MRYTLLLVFVFGAACSSRETYQDEVHRKRTNQTIAETIHERNFRIWKEKQRGYVGMKSFKHTPLCPDWSMHTSH